MAMLRTMKSAATATSVLRRRIGDGDDVVVRGERHDLRAMIERLPGVQLRERNDADDVAGARGLEDAPLARGARLHIRAAVYSCRKIDDLHFLQRQQFRGAHPD